MTARWPAWWVRASPVRRTGVRPGAGGPGRDAALFRPAWEHTEGVDGYVSLEVAPDAAYDAAATVALPRRLYGQFASSSKSGGHGLVQAVRAALWYWWPHGGAWALAGADASGVPQPTALPVRTVLADQRPSAQALGAARHRASDCRSVCSSVSTLRSGWACRATSCAQTAISESDSYSGSPPRSNPMAARTAPASR
jgi:hypothetical protein